MILNINEHIWNQNVNEQSLMLNLLYKQGIIIYYLFINFA